MGSIAVLDSSRMPRRSKRSTINISLTPELEAFVDRCVDSGRYQTISEVVREALRLLADQHLQLERKSGSSGSSSGAQDQDSFIRDLRELISEYRNRKTRTAAQEE